MNALPYDGLREAGWDVHLVVPARWKDDYRPEGFAPDLLPGLSSKARVLPVLMPGHPQRHLYLTAPGRLVAAAEPDIAFLEQEPFALVTGQWLGALRRRKIPFGLQHDENLDRPLPGIARAIRTLAVNRAAFVAARSPQAGALLRALNPRLRIEVVPHAVPDWPVLARSACAGDETFTVGYAGRLTPAKGIRDLLAATERMAPGTRLLVVGNGEMRDEVKRADTPQRPVELRTGVGHADMPAVYAEMDVLVLPSRTTPTWTEQFGRVLVEAMACGVPVVASDSGEMPWVIEATGGGVLFPEGSVDALAAILTKLRQDPGRRQNLAEQGRAAVERSFSESAIIRQMDSLLREILDTRAARG
ncbi:MAG: glycosyltransferase family 4 protein [Solirubrobacteraceae bacterium]